jgi:CDP-glucose 4,6-dehydratase
VRDHSRDHAIEGEERGMSADFWRDRPVLVTGGTGLLGSWLVAALVERGARTVMLVRDRVPDALVYTSGAADRCVEVRGDVADGDTIERTLAEYEIDAVFHLAARTIVGQAYVDPRGTFRSNIEGTWEVLDACRRNGAVQRIVVASSDKAYGSQAQLPYQEDQPLIGRHPYDVSKSCTDLIAQSYGITYGLPVAVTRCGNLFGGGDLNFNRLIPGTIRWALAGEQPILRSDGTPLRDWLYVEDAVDAYLTTAERVQEPALRGEAFNFSTESPMNALEVTHKVLEACGRPDIEPDIQATAQHEIQDQFLASTKAREVLDWEPRYGFDEGIERTVSWYRQYLEQSAPALS